MSRITIVVIAFTIVSFVTPALAADAACQAVFDTRFKLFSVPSHSYTIETLPGGKSENHETIFANGAIYVLMKGKWIHSPMTPQDMLKQEAGKHPRLKEYVPPCTRRNGERRSRGPVHGAQRKRRNQVRRQTWISKSKGLPLKTEEDIDTGDGDKRHMSIRYEYSNVRPPVGVR